MKFVVICDNAKSFQVATDQGRKSKVVVLVRCDRLDRQDNERGHKLAEKIAAFLSTLPDEARQLTTSTCSTR